MEDKEIKEYVNNRTYMMLKDMGAIRIEEELKKQEAYLEKLKKDIVMLLASKRRDDATEMIVNYIEDNYHLYTTRSDKDPEIWIYKAGIYVPDGRSHIKEITRMLTDKAFTTFISNQVISKIEADTYIDFDKFFGQAMKNKEEVPVKNGILNLKERSLSKFTPEKVFFTKLPVIFDPEASCGLIEAFLSDVLAHKDDIQVYYELGGFCLLKEYKFEKAFMFHGNGRNGKGKSIELIKKVIGAENCASIPLSSLKSDSFQISELYGKHVNLAGDLDNQTLKDTATFKTLTGRDSVNGKRKFLRDINFVNYATFVFACNELPMVYDLSKGFWDRWILLDFPYYFASKDEIEKYGLEDNPHWKLRDEDIINKITDEKQLSGLLNKFLDGLERLENNEGFSSTKGTEEIKNTWVRSANSFIAFCMDHIEEDYESQISKKELRRAYSNYCKKHKLAGKSDIVIKRFLQEMYGASEEQKEFLGSLDRYWIGIKFKEETNYQG